MGNRVTSKNRKGTVRYLVSVLVAAFMVTCHARVLHVSPFGDDSNDGLSWATAKRTITAALQSSEAGDESWVADGVYNERITLRWGVACYGGFRGNETQRDQRDFLRWQTILDGGRNGSVVTVPNSALESTILDGFVIRNGRAQDGGGVYSTVASPTIRNNLFIMNEATRYGGAIYSATGAPKLFNNRFHYNWAQQNTGGVYLTDASGAVVANNTFIGCERGALFAQAADLTITGNTFIGNTMHIVFYAVVQLFKIGTNPRIRFVNNLIAYNAGGVYMDLGPQGYLVRYNCFYANLKYDIRDTTERIPDPQLGNIVANPLIVSLRHGEVHLAPNSPCIDAGDNAFVQGVTDIDNAPRVVGARVDIGADEYDGTLWTPTPRRLYVRSNADDGADGLSWETAKRTITAALQASLPGDEIWVAQGVYNESITLAPGVYLLGGFEGYEDNELERDPRNHPTTITFNGAATVRASSRIGATAGLDGFIITGSSVGIDCQDAAPLLVNNQIIRNKADGVRGGAPFLIANRIAHNRGIAVSEFTGALLVNNAIIGNGGGVQGATPIIPALYAFGNLIVGNSGNTVGAIHLRVSSNIVQIVNNTIAYNMTSNLISYAGGLRLDGTVQLPQQLVANNIIYANRGGVYILGSGNTGNGFRNNCVYGNFVYDYEPYSTGDPTGQNGNIRVDPGFVSPLQEDWRLNPDSPCRNTGMAPPVLWSVVDLVGNARVLEGAIDRGAYETTGEAYTPPTRRVYRVATWGDDANDGSSWAAAMRTIGNALKVARPGDEVWIAQGTYEESLFLPRGVAIYGGFAGNETAREQSNPRQNPTVLKPSPSGVAITVERGYSTLTQVDGLIIQGYGFNTETRAVIAEHSSLKLTRNVIRNHWAQQSYPWPAPVFLDFGMFEILNNQFLHNGSNNSAAMAIFLQSYEGVFANNVVAHSYGYFMRAPCAALRSAGTLLVANNTFVDNYGMVDIQSRDRTNAVVTNNLIAYNLLGLRASADINATIAIRHNCVYGNYRTNYVSPDQTGMNGNISVDPRLASWRQGDYHIQPDSPCRDAGDNTYAIGFDIDGQSRVLGARVDIGADESDGTRWQILPRRWFVSPTGNDSADGSSWATAKRTVNAALQQAEFGDEIWVAQGVYPETIQIRRGVALYGGFAGNETSLSQRDPSTRPTILDGENTRQIARVEPYATLGTLLDGFILRNGLSSQLETRGGGIGMQNSALQIVRTRFENCRAIPTGQGAALYANNSIVISDRCEWRQNRVDNALPGVAHVTNSEYAQFTRSRFINNTMSSVFLSGVLNFYATQAVVANNLFEGNVSTASRGGALALDSGNTLVANNLFLNNRAYSGGAIYVHHSINVRILNNTFVANSGIGSAIYTADPLTLANNIFASHQGTAVYMERVSLNRFANCFYNNYNAYNTGELGSTDFIADPRFLNSSDGDYRLHPSSPCVNRGNNEYVYTALGDIEGQLRIVDAQVDVGADEMFLIDVNADGCVDDADLLAVLSTFDQTGANLSTDVNRDGSVDDADLLMVLFAFGQGC